MHENIKTSTPNAIPKVTGRRSVHSRNSPNTPSPILRKKHVDPRQTDDEDLNGESDTLSSEDETQEQTHSMSKSDFSSKDNINRTPQNVTFSNDGKWCVGLIIILFIAVIAINFLPQMNTNETKTINITTLKTLFPFQSSEIWDSLESGIIEAKRFNKPIVYVFIHERNAEKTLQSLLKHISLYVCNILKGNCETNPLILSSEQINTPEARQDYGYIIEKYRNQLEDQGVMVVRDLDKIPGLVARAFHSFCDEYSPLVGKSVIIFTINVNKFPPENDMHFIEDVLYAKWNEVEENELSALLTRVLNTVLKILPEQNI